MNLIFKMVLLVSFFFAPFYLPATAQAQIQTQTNSMVDTLDKTSDPTDTTTGPSVFSDEPTKFDLLAAALKKGDKAAVADMVQYPLSREQPLPPIRNKEEFIQNYEDFFNLGSTPVVIASCDDIIDKDGVNGTYGTARGEVWVSEEGMIIRINVVTDQQQKKAAAAREEEKKTLYPAIRGYSRVYMECRTKQHFVWVFEKKEKIYYAAWDLSSPDEKVNMHRIPNLFLEGEVSEHGSSGNTTFTFKNSKYAYDVEYIVIGTENDHDDIVISKNGEVIRTEDCEGSVDR